MRVTTYRRRITRGGDLLAIGMTLTAGAAGCQSVTALPGVPAEDPPVQHARLVVRASTPSGAGVVIAEVLVFPEHPLNTLGPTYTRDVPTSDDGGAMAVLIKRSLPSRDGVPLVSDTVTASVRVRTAVGVDSTRAVLRFAPFAEAAPVTSVQLVVGRL